MSDYLYLGEINESLNNIEAAGAADSATLTNIDTNIATMVTSNANIETNTNALSTIDTSTSTSATNSATIVSNTNSTVTNLGNITAINTNIETNTLNTNSTVGNVLTVNTQIRDQPDYDSRVRLGDHAGFLHRILKFNGNTSDANENCMVVNQITLIANYSWNRTGVFNARISSNSGNDDNTGGTGARKVTIEYLDNAYAIQSEVLNLAGAGLVNIAGGATISDIRKCVVTDAGSTGSNEGVLIIQTNTGAHLCANCEIGTNEVAFPGTTVPAGKNILLGHLDLAVCSNVSTDTVRVNLYKVQASAESTTAFPRRIGTWYLTCGTHHVDCSHYTAFEPEERIFFSLQRVDGTGIVYVSGYLNLKEYNE